MVFDTMVLAYALLGVQPFRDDATAALAKAPAIMVPDSFRAELANVLWQWIRTRHLPLERGIAILHESEALVTEFVSSAQLTEQALQLSVAHQVAAYDTLFVALAIRGGVMLVTCDDELLRKFPDITISPTAYLRKKAR
jgi:predicted nucleic acid-binding protein